jgi:putative spermidine/putrescine transport system ATP-binding protein
MVIDNLVPTSIRLRQCSKRYADGTMAVDPLDLDIAAGETVVILGPSGCGKTTTLRMIAGLEAPDPGGKIYFGDDDVTAIPIERRNVGMVFQSYALFPNLDVIGNIAYGLRLRGVAKAERTRRARELMSMMHLDKFATRRIDQLSGGQKQRVALARALAVEPRVLLLDEPLTALDAQLRDALRFEINALLRRLGITTVYVTHDQGEAMSLADRIIVMDHGRIAQSGSPREIYARPATRFVGDFIGTMNRIRGQVLAGSFVCPAGVIDGVSLAVGCEEILFRPEAVSLGAPGIGGLAGTITSVAYMGNCTRLLVDGFGGPPVIVECSDEREFRNGQQVALHIRPNALLAFAGA